MKELVQKINPVRNSRRILISPRELLQTVIRAAERRGIISNGINIMFRRGENKETIASKKFWGKVGRASDIARSIRETGKFQARAKPWRNTFFFLIVAALILFALSYAQ